MAGENSSTELQSLLEAITSSDVVENRVQLLTRLEELDICNKTDLTSLMASLTMFWEDFTCLDISQCLLNKTILHVAAKQIESDHVSGCLGHFLSLGTKASIWGGKHLKMALMSTDESQEEEHYNLFFQLLLDLLNYSAACFLSLAKNPVANDKELMIIVEKFTFEQLNLTKDSISEIKKIAGVGLEVLKVAQRVHESVIQLCSVYISSINQNLHNAISWKDKSCLDSEEADNTNHVVKIVQCAINQLCDLGVLAANDGGNLVSLLSSSWKGVLTLLQLGKGALKSKLKVADIILTLISLAKDSLRGAAKSWSLPLAKISKPEAERFFVPVKFYLINAVRISFQYPYQAFSVYKDISLFVLMISTFGMLLSREELLKSASEALVKLLEPTSFHLLSSLLNSAELTQVDKFLILDWLFHDENMSNSLPGDSTNRHDTGKMDSIFSLSCDHMNGLHELLLGRVALFLNFLKSAPDIDEDVRLGISRKLGWILKVIIDEEAYAWCLTLNFPIPRGSSEASEIAYQPMLFSIRNALKSFMIVLASTVVWKEMEDFLLENFFHPHFLCWEVVMELWCFLMRHAEEDMMVDIVEKLYLLLTFVASPESVLVPSSALRRAARSTCLILMQVPQSTVDRFYGMIVDDNVSQSSSFVLVALLMEGLPLNLLSDKMKSSATQRIVTDYFEFIESFDGASLRVSGYGSFGSPVFILSAALQSLQVSISDIDMKTLKFLVAILHSYRNTEEASTKSHYRKLLSETLGIISNVKHLYTSDGMEEVVLELRKLFISTSEFADNKLYECKPNLASFMAGLGYIVVSEDENSAKSSAMWELYHMILRERHWAFVHLAIAAFGYFSARTSYNELWRFVPPNAALSFDLDSGNEINQDRFLSELKAYFDRETSPSSDQVQFLIKEGQMLKEMVQNIENTSEAMEIDIENQPNKRRKLQLPDGISEGMELLQNGLKVIGDDLPQLRQNHFDCTEYHDKFMAHFSHLQEVISQFVGLAGT